MYSDLLGEGIVDILYSAEFNGKTGYIPIFLLIEHQSTNNPMMAFRIQKYMMRICDDHLRANKGSKLPLIYPSILWNGKGSYRAPRSFYELFEDKELAKRFLTEDINVIDVSKIEDFRLREQYQTGLMLYAMKHIRDKSLEKALRYVMDILKTIFTEDFEYGKDVVSYIVETGDGSEDVLELLCQAAPSNKKGEIMTIAEKLIEKGKLQGIDIGMEEAMLKVAKAMMSQGFENEVIAKCTGLSLAKISSIKN